MYIYNCVVCKVKIKTVLTLWRQWISIRTFQIYYPIRVIFGIRHVHIMLLRIYELCENRLIKGPTFHMGLNEIMLTRVKWNDVVFWKSNCWTKCDRIHNLQSCEMCRYSDQVRRYCKISFFFESLIELFSNLWLKETESATQRLGFMRAGALGAVPILLT